MPTIIDISFILLDTAVLIFLLIALFADSIDSEIVYLGLLLQVVIRKLFNEISTSIKIKGDDE